MAARCSDGTQPNYTAKTCATGTYIAYNPGAASCTTAPSTPCTFTYDANSNGQILYEANDSSGDPGYQTGMLVTAIVASQNKAGVRPNRSRFKYKSEPSGRIRANLSHDRAGSDRCDWLLPVLRRFPKYRWV